MLPYDQSIDIFLNIFVGGFPVFKGQKTNFFFLLS